MPDSGPDVLVVGAGAAGLMSAIVAARQTPAPRILLVEGMKRPGAKILVSGGGRCNVTNASVGAGDFHGNRRLIARVLSRFGAADTVAFFASLGVKLEREPEFDKLFPDDDRSRTVLAALLDECARLGIGLRCGFRADRVTREGGRFAVGAGPETLTAGRLVLATGGRSLPRSGSDGQGYVFARALGHSVTPTHPALVPLVLAPHPFAGLSGVSFPAELSVWQRGRRLTSVAGPVLITHFGISGPAALDVSRHLTTAAAEDRLELRLSVFPGRTPESVERDWLALAGGGGGHARALPPALPARLGAALLERAGVSPDTPLAALTRPARRRLLETLMALVLPVTGDRGFTAAEVTAGGVPLEEVDLRTMRSRRCPGLHIVGELLDADGRIGGFNFQWAWSTGFIAGEALGSLG